MRQQMDKRGLVQTTALILIAAVIGVLGLFGARFGKQWIRREIARAFKELQPFQPASFTVIPTEESFEDDPTEG